MVRVQIGADAGHPLAELRYEGQRGGLHHGDVMTEGGTGGGDLGADEAAADDHDLGRATGQLVAERLGVVEGAQGVHPGAAGSAGPAGEVPRAWHPWR